MARRVFISFDADDKNHVNLFRGQAQNPNLEIDFYDSSLKTAIDSVNAEYIKSQIRPKIEGSSVLLCLLGYNTHRSNWVNWEIDHARNHGKGLVGVRLHNSSSDIVPQKLQLYNGIIVNWDHIQIKNAIETAAIRAGY